MGSGVTNVEVGDAVVVHPLITCGLCRACRAGDDMHCVASIFLGVNADGGFAELLKTNARVVVKLPTTREYVGSMGPTGEPARESIAPHCALRYHGRNMTRSRREELEVERSKRF